MTSLGERLKNLRLKNDMSQAELAALLGISRGQISKIESDSSNNITVNTLTSYMNIFSVSADYIVSGESGSNYFLPGEENMIASYRQLSDDDKIKIQHFMEVVNISNKVAYPPSSTPLLKETSTHYSFDTKKKFSVPAIGKVAAGVPIEAIENVLDFVETDSPDVQFALYAKGDSMEPVIYDGDVIFVHKVPELENGEIGILTINNEGTCKIFYDYPDRIELRSLNPSYEPLIYFKKYLNDFQIVGKVILTEDQKLRFSK